MTQYSSHTEIESLEEIKHILLKRERELLQELKEQIEDKEKLSRLVSPIVEEHIDILRQHFPAEFEKAVNAIFDRRLKESQERLLSLIYPNIGRMVQNYVGYQIQLVRESIEEQYRRSPFGRLMARLRGVKESDYLFGMLGKFKVEEVYIIRKQSGLIIGSASTIETVDKDALAGMLTAIKSFVEDAFKRSHEELEMIQYGSYQIMIRNFFNYYIALVLSGTLTNQEKQKLRSDINKFAQRELSKDLEDQNGSLHLYFKKKLKRFFLDKYTGKS